MRARVEVRKAHGRYVEELTERLWRYRERRFAGQGHLFDDHRRPSPPVFVGPEVRWNVLTRPGDSAAEQERVWSQLPLRAGHRWLRSMKSSQALVWSVFGNLRAYGRLGLLADLLDDRGQPLFPSQLLGSQQMHLEHEVTYLGEPRPTSLDVLFDDGRYRVAVEGKLSEAEVGGCSRPDLKSDRDPSYARDYCDGTYTRQRGRWERCSLAEIGVAYWRYVPRLFRWPADRDQSPCPLQDTYQLVRNVLAACVHSDGLADPARGHAVLLYDTRNPQFGPGGAGWQACQDVRVGLRDPGLLRPGTWQQVAAAITRDREMAWLAEELEHKYGITPEG